MMDGIFKLLQVVTGRWFFKAPVVIATQESPALSVSGGSVRLGGAVLPTASTGFTYLPAMQSAPTGVPDFLYGSVPIVFDITTFTLYAYVHGSGWKSVVLT